MKKFFMLMGIFAAGCALVACSPSNKGGNNKPSDDPNDPEKPGVNDPTTPNDPNIPDNEQTTGDGKGAKITFAAGDGAFIGGSKSITVTADSSGEVDISDAPVLDGHAFGGWYNGAVKYDPSARYDSACTFTARYESGSGMNVYTALFDEQSTVEIKIDMSDAEWKKLNNDYIEFEERDSKSPIYRMADSVTIRVKSNGADFYDYYYEEVGVRMKGNTSRHEFYNDDGFFDLVHLKLSFKETFDDPDDGYKQSELKEWTDETARAARKDRLFGDMEKIDIKFNSTKDETYVRELYAMKLFRENDIYAPNITLAGVTALERDSSYKNLGVFRIHECVDEKFVEHHIGDRKAGDLWKCTYTKTGPADMTNYDLDNRIGVEDELKGKFFSYDKKTNKKKDKVTGKRDFSSMINFIRAVNENDANYSSVLDTQYFARFEAVNYILGNPDCIRNNYNNYYFYFRPSDGKAIIIPYDYDRCLGITADWNPTGSANMYLQPYTRQTAAAGGQNNPLYKNLIDKGAPTDDGSVLMMYRSYLLSMSEAEMFSAQAFDAYKNNYKARYSGYIADNDKRFDNNYAGNVSYSQYIETKLETLISNIDNYNA